MFLSFKSNSQLDFRDRKRTEGRSLLNEFTNLTQSRSVPPPRQCQPEESWKPGPTRPLISLYPRGWPGSLPSISQPFCMFPFPFPFFLPFSNPRFKTNRKLKHEVKLRTSKTSRSKIRKGASELANEANPPKVPRLRQRKAGTANEGWSFPHLDFNFLKLLRRLETLFLSLLVSILFGALN